MNKILQYFLLLVLFILTSLGIYYFDFLKNVSDQLSNSDAFVPTSVVTSSQNENSSETSYKIVEIANNLFVPWSIVFTSNERFLVTERNGNIKEVVNDNLNKTALLKLEDVETGGEEGLMGLAVDPNYDDNKYLYICYAYNSQDGLADKVVRLIDNQTEIIEDEILLDNIPAATNHAGCRLGFGPDGKLYITTGDAIDKNIAQDVTSLGGKILRINKDGSIPSDNIFNNSAVYTLGHRNPQGIDWTENEILLSSEHGPSGFDGPPGGDEVNIVIPGANYGWPIVSHEKTNPEFISPLKVFTPAIAPGSLMVYTSDLFSQFKGKVFLGGLRGEGIYILTFKSNSYREITDFSKISEINYGRIREVVEAPNGEIYFTTSNRDGRGTLREDDDKIYKITISDN